MTWTWPDAEHLRRRLLERFADTSRLAYVFDESCNHVQIVEVDENGKFYVNTWECDTGTTKDMYSTEKLDEMHRITSCDVCEQP